jgi:hypothetical protein
MERPRQAAEEGSVNHYEFKFGQLVGSTDTALRWGLFKRQMFGVVVHQDNLFGVRVHIKGRKTSADYSSDFWRPVRAERSGRGGGR